MSRNLISSISKCLIIFLIILLTINILPIDFYVDIEKIIKTKIIYPYASKYLPHLFIFKSIKNFDYERYSLVFHNVFVFINFIFISVIIFLHSFFLKNLDENKEFLNLFLCSMIFPISLQSVTSPNSESFFSIIIIYLTSLFLCKNSKIRIVPIMIPLFIYSYLIDSGNSLVFSFFILFLIGMLILNKIFNWKVSFVIFIILFIVSLFYSKYILSYVGSIFDAHKTSMLILDLELLSLTNLNVIEILKRYIYFWFTLFGIVNHFKLFIISTILMIIVMFCYLGLKTFKNFNFFKQKYYDSKFIISFCCVFLFPLMLISILPTHAYAKYYIFIVPFIIKFLSFYFTKSSLFYLSTIYSSVFVLNSYLIIYTNSRIMEYT